MADIVTNFSVKELPSAGSISVKDVTPKARTRQSKIFDNVTLAWWRPETEIEGDVAIRYVERPDDDWIELLGALSKPDRYLVVIGPDAAHRDDAANRVRKIALRLGAIWKSVPPESGAYERGRRQVQRELSRLENELAVTVPPRQPQEPEGQ